MSLTLYYHPLSSFCMKALVGLYELDVSFAKRLVDLANEADRTAFLQVWPMGKFPVLRDEARGITVAESSIILEYIDERSAPAARLLPADRDEARDCRLRDRFFDLYVNAQMGKIVTDKLRPEAQRDSYGVGQARAQLEQAYDVADDWLRAGPWAVGSAFTMADCAAAPALFYAKQVLPFGDARKHLSAYFSRLAERPSFARAVAEAKPYAAMFPG
jgi:glutathione S-transferase